MSGLTTLTMQVLKMSVLRAPVMPALTQVLTVPIMLVIQIMTIPVPCQTNSSRRPWRFQGRTRKRKHARAIIAAAGRADMDAIEDSQLIDALSKSLKVGKRAITKLLREERNAYRAGQDNFDRKQQTVADTLLYLVEQAGWKTWKDRRTDEAVVTIAPGQHLPARSRLMRQALIRLWRNQRPDGRRVCPTEAVDAVIATLAAEAAALQPTMASVVRYAAAGDDRMAPDGVVVDFGDETFEALFITPTGMTVIGPETIDAVGIRFIRPMLMSELPRPKRDATPQEAIDRLVSIDQPRSDHRRETGVRCACSQPAAAAGCFAGDRVGCATRLRQNSRRQWLEVGSRPRGRWGERHAENAR